MSDKHGMKNLTCTLHNPVIPHAGISCFTHELGSISVPEPITRQGSGVSDVSLNWLIGNIQISSE